MSLPIIAIVGRPNVGKSTLFNRLSNSKNALVSDFEGLTRDRQYARINIKDKACNIIDTGGINNSKDLINLAINEQTKKALAEAYIVYFVISKKDGINIVDAEIASQLRKIAAKVILICNKSEDADEKNLLEFYELGIEQMLAISAKNNKGITELIEKTANILDEYEYEEEEDNLKGTVVAMFGRPNVGKSTFINKVLNDNRLLATNIPGTTRDAIFIPFAKNNKFYTLIDTAGIRRKRSVDNKIEKFSIVKTLEVLNLCHVAILIVDSSEGITEQDASLLGMIDKKGKALIIVNNKWDKLDDYQKKEAKRKLDTKISFINYASIHYTSALTGLGINKVFQTIDKAYKNAGAKFSTSMLNNILIKANQNHKPPVNKGRRLKIKYIHQASIFPPTFTLHGNNLEDMSKSYNNYLKNFFIKELKLSDTPIQFNFKTTENPFKDKKNKLNDRQIKKRKRLIKFNKKK